MVSLYAIQPYQFRLTHDISIENFNNIDDCADLENDLDNCEFSSYTNCSTGNTTGSTSSYHDVNTRTTTNANINNSTALSDWKNSNSPLNTPNTVRNGSTDLEWLSNKMGQLDVGEKHHPPIEKHADLGNRDDDVFINEDFLHKKYTEDSPVIDPNQRLIRRNRSKKARRPRKLPDIPTASPKRNVTLSLAEELQAADPTLKLTILSKGEIIYSPITPEPRLETSDSIPFLDKRDSMGSCDSETKQKAEEFCTETPDQDLIVADLLNGFSEEPPKVEVERHLSDEVHKSSNTTATCSALQNQKALLSVNNVYLREDSSPEEKQQFSKRASVGLSKLGKKDSTDSGCSRRVSVSSNVSVDLDELEVTHRGCHKFVPRHSDEMFIEIGDPVHVEVEADDLWCEGINLRSGKRGIFPSAYATDLNFLEEDGEGMRHFKFSLRFLGSVEVNYHKGNDVIVHAINKVAMTRRMTLNSATPPMCTVEINEFGIKMSEKIKRSKVLGSPTKASISIRKRIAKILKKPSDKEEETGLNHFFSLKNVSFCGYHPKNERYFAFITKHPLEMRFACHVFLGDNSTKRVAEAVGVAFKAFYQQYMAFVHPTEDIYLE